MSSEEYKPNYLLSNIDETAHNSDWSWDHYPGSEASVGTVNLGGPALDEWKA